MLIFKRAVNVVCLLIWGGSMCACPLVALFSSMFESHIGEEQAEMKIPAEV